MCFTESEEIGFIEGLPNAGCFAYDTRTRIRTIADLDIRPSFKRGHILLRISQLLSFTTASGSSCWYLYPIGENQGSKKC